MDHLNLMICISVAICALVLVFVVALVEAGMDQRREQTHREWQRELRSHDALCQRRAAARYRAARTGRSQVDAALSRAERQAADQKEADEMSKLFGIGRKK